MAKALRVSDGFDFDNPAATDSEVEYHQEPSVRSHDDHDPSVDKCRPRGSGATLRCSVGHSRGAADLVRRPGKHCGRVHSKHDIWIEHRKKRFEASSACGS